jgi:hypothetical protein
VVPLSLLVQSAHEGWLFNRSLFKDWKGAPTTHALRLHGNVWPNAQRKQWRSAVSEATNITLPGSASETSNPQGADGIYETAVATLRALTRDKQRFPFVAMENRNYGYERNLLAMKPVGLLITGLTLATLAVLDALRLGGWRGQLSVLSVTIGIAFVVACGAFWIVVPSKAKAWLVGGRYAERLMDAALQISGKSVP